LTVKEKVIHFFQGINKNDAKKFFMCKILACTIYKDRKKRDEEEIKAIEILQRYGFLSREIDWYMEEIQIRILEYKKDIDEAYNDEEEIYEYFRTSEDDIHSVYKIIEEVVNSDFEIAPEEQEYLTKIENIIKERK